MSKKDWERKRLDLIWAGIRILSLMTKPTHFFLRLLSHMLNTPTVMEAGYTGIEDSNTLVDGALQNTAQQNPVPLLTPTLGKASSNTRNTGFGFRYGAACNEKW